MSSVEKTNCFPPDIEQMHQAALLQLISIAINVQYMDDYVYETYMYLMREYERYREMYYLMRPDTQLLVHKFRQQVTKVHNESLPGYITNQHLL